MTERLRGNALVGQSGGPTSVINASLAGAIEAAQGQRGSIPRILGMRFGIEGFMHGMYVDLGKQSPSIIKGLHTTPSSALGSCRYKVQDGDLPVILKQLKKLDIRYFFLIGGNDTMDTIQRVEAYCASQGYDLRGVGIPKTVDNDLYGTDHTPGYGSAARYVAISVLEAGLLARDMQKVDRFAVHQTVGRSAGWLAAAAALAKTTPDSAPHLILMPERPFVRGKFLAEAKRIQKKYGYVYVVVGEGVSYADGRPVSAAETKDRFSNLEYGAMGGASAAMRIHQMLSKEFGWRGEFQVTESLPMAGADRASAVDVKEAAACGRKAVQWACAGKSGVMVSMARKKGATYGVEYRTTALSAVAVRAKALPPHMISPNGMYVTRAFLDYARPLVGKLPAFVSLDLKRK